MRYCQIQLPVCQALDRTQAPHGPLTHLIVEVYYDLGGSSIFTGGGVRRGLYLLVCPVEKTIDQILCFHLQGGKRRLLEPLVRKNDARGLAMAERVVRELVEREGDLIWPVVQQVLNENHLKQVE